MSKPKVLFIGPFQDGTGYANSAINTALAIEKSGVDIACRNIKLTSQTIDPPDKIKSLFKTKIKNPTHVIQNVLPSVMTRYGKSKHIGYFFSETTNFFNSGWQYYLNLMDEVWVSCRESAEASLNSGVKPPIVTVPIPGNPEKYSQILPENTSLKRGNRYMFYFIGDFSARKNVVNLIKTYLQTFSKSDHVVLVLKTYVDNTSPEQSMQIVQDEIKNIKQGLRKHHILDYYPPIVVITDYLSDQEILNIHQTGDCFVSTERGAAWNIPAFDAMAVGNQVIVNGWGGQTAFIKHNPMVGQYIIPYKLTNVYGMNNCGYKGMYSCHEKWAEPDYNILSAHMKEAYTYNCPKIPNRVEPFMIDQCASKFAEILQ